MRMQQPVVLMAPGVEPALTKLSNFSGWQNVVDAPEIWPKKLANACWKNYYTSTLSSAEPGIHLNMLGRRARAEDREELVQGQGMIGRNATEACAGHILRWQQLHSSGAHRNCKNQHRGGHTVIAEQ